MNLQEIFNRANTLAENNFATIADLIDHLNEAQDIIARFDPSMAEPSYTFVTDQGIMLPYNLLRLAQIYAGETGSERIYRPKSPAWKNVIPTPDLPLETPVRIEYYGRPAPLVAAAVTMVPGVPAQYHQAMAAYAAKMFYLIDDDPAMQSAFKQQFLDSLGSLKSQKGVSTTFTNY